MTVEQGPVSAPLTRLQTNKKNPLLLTELTWSPEPGQENSRDQTEMWTINRSAGKQETMEEGEDHETPHRIDRSIDQSIIQTDV